jgi:hypothetical protein
VGPPESPDLDFYPAITCRYPDRFPALPAIAVKLGDLTRIWLGRMNDWVKAFMLLYVERQDSMQFADQPGEGGAAAIGAVGCGLGIRRGFNFLGIETGFFG